MYSRLGKFLYDNRIGRIFMSRGFLINCIYFEKFIKFIYVVIIINKDECR